MLLTHFIVICIGQMLLCQSVLFFICWFVVLKNHLGTRVSPGHDVIRLCLLLYNICLLFILVLVLVTWPTPHPEYVAAGICQYFYSGMGH